MNDILYGDCNELILDIPDNSIDFVLTDPPYGTNDDKGKTIKRSGIDKNFKVMEWDKELPLSYIEHLPRIMKDDTWGCIFTDNMATTIIWNKIEEVGLNPRNTFYWVKPNKPPTPRKNFKSCVETAVIFTKGKTNKKWYGGGNVNNYLKLSIISPKEKLAHETQKPIRLMKHLIKLFTVDGDVVFDPFLGSGTTAAAAKRLGRKYIGFEIDKKYLDIANDRLSKINSSDERVLNKFFIY